MVPSGKYSEEESMADSSKCGGKEEGEGEVLLGKMPQTKSDQSKEAEELQFDDGMQGVQCKNGIKHLAVFGAEGKRCAAMPH